MREKAFNVQRPTPNVERSKPASSPSAYDLEERLLSYAAEIIRICERLPNTRPANHVTNQLLRSGTAALPNHGEAQAAESRDDFIHKLSICLKELRESRRWLLLIQQVPLVKDLAVVEPLIRETEELVKIFAKSIRTAKSGKLSVGRSTLDVGRSNQVSET